jgi:hypothetical protein
MSTSTPRRTRAAADRREMAWASGLALFAGLMMIITGLDQAILGFAAILGNDVSVPVKDNLVGLDATAWGWLHLGFGLVLALTGVAVLQGRAWARAAGIGVVMLNLVLAFVFLPHYPVWAMLLIAFNVAVIWGLARYDGRVR